MCRSCPRVVLELHVAQADFQGALLPLHTPHVADGRAREALVRPCRQYRIIRGAPVQESDERGTRVVQGCGFCVGVLGQLISELKPSSANVKFKFINLIGQIKSELLVRLVYRHLCDTFFFCKHTRYTGGWGRERGYWNVLPMKNISLTFQRNHFFPPFYHIQLVEHENVRAVLSYNEAYELNYFTNSKEVRPALQVLFVSTTLLSVSCQKLCTSFSRA